MRYLKKFASSADTQTALNEGVLGKPYVAIISGVGIDYNTLSAQTTIGTWEDVYGDHTVYTFTVTDSSPSKWENQVKIGTISCWYYTGSEVFQGDIDIYLTNNSGVWEFAFYNGVILLTTVNDEGVAYEISVSEDYEFGSSDWVAIKIDREGESYVFTFSNDENYAMSITTIDPE